MFDYQPPADLLAGRTILITGAGGGIGQAAALSCAAHGASVVLLGRNSEKLEQVYDAIEAAGGPRPAMCALDLESAGTGQYTELADMIESEFGALHGLLHNAALLGNLSPIETHDVASWQRVMQVNVTAQFCLTRSLVPLLAAGRDASVVFTSSSVGRRGRAHWGAYAVSKFATEGLMQVLADEVYDLHGIRCNSLNPGATRTNMRAHAYPGENPDNNPTPAEIMPAYLFLLGSESRHVNGQALNAREGAPQDYPA